MQSADRVINEEILGQNDTGKIFGRDPNNLLIFPASRDILSIPADGSHSEISLHVYEKIFKGETQRITKKGNRFKNLRI